jgi:hypothetical protein
LRKKYEDLYISLTIPADRNGLTNLGIALVNLFRDNGATANIVNIMAMNIGAIPNGTSWGVIAT